MNERYPFVAGLATASLKRRHVMVRIPIQRVYCYLREMGGESYVEAAKRIVARNPKVRQVFDLIDRVIRDQEQKLWRDPERFMASRDTRYA